MQRRLWTQCQARHWVSLCKKLSSSGSNEIESCWCASSLLGNNRNISFALLRFAILSVLRPYMLYICIPRKISQSQGRAIKLCKHETRYSSKEALSALFFVCLNEYMYLSRRDLFKSMHSFGSRPTYVKNATNSNNDPSLLSGGQSRSSFFRLCYIKFSLFNTLPDRAD